MHLPQMPTGRPLYVWCWPPFSSHLFWLHSAGFSKLYNLERHIKTVHTKEATRGDNQKAQDNRVQNKKKATKATKGMARKCGRQAHLKWHTAILASSTTTNDNAKHPAIQAVDTTFLVLHHSHRFPVWYCSTCLCTLNSGTLSLLLSWFYRMSCIDSDPPDLGTYHLSSLFSRSRLSFSMWFVFMWYHLVVIWVVVIRAM